MSHALGSRCETHRWVMSPDNCPECPEAHGYTFQPCDERCPQNRGYDTGAGGAMYHSSNGGKRHPVSRCGVDCPGLPG